MTPKRIFITGANRGIGLALTEQSLQRGDIVLASCRQPEQAPGLMALATSTPHRLLLLRLDVSDESSIAAAARQVGEHVEAIDLLINNAGVFSRGESIRGLQPETMLHAMHVNAIGPMIVTQHLLPWLEASPHPRILNISSQLGSIQCKSDGQHYSYASSKAALNMLTRTLAFELSPSGIIVVALHPGWAQTDMGGPNATIPPQESAAGILALADRLTLADSNRFYTWQGHEHPW